MEVPRAHRLTELEKECVRFLKAVSDPTLDKPILNVVQSGRYRAIRAAGIASILSSRNRGVPSTAPARCSAGTA